jgi:hypothetical protein
VDLSAATPVSIDELLASCPASPAVEIPGAAGYFGPFGLGKRPVWLGGWGARPAATPVAASAAQSDKTEQFLIRNTAPKIPGYGWPMKALWVIDPQNFRGTVTIHGSSRDGSVPLWFQINGGAITQRAVLDPEHPAIPIQHGDWREFPSYVIFPATGCFHIMVEWDGGSWRAQVPFFAADSEP